MISDEETLRRRMEEYARGKGSHSRIGLTKLLANFKGYMQILQRLFPEYKSHGDLHKGLILSFLFLFFLSCVGHSNNKNSVMAEDRNEKKVS